MTPRLRGLHLQPRALVLCLAVASLARSASINHLTGRNTITFIDDGYQSSMPLVADDTALQMPPIDRRQFAEPPDIHTEVVSDDGEGGVTLVADNFFFPTAQKRQFSEPSDIRTEVVSDDGEGGVTLIADNFPFPSIGKRQLTPAPDIYTEVVSDNGEGGVTLVASNFPLHLPPSVNRREALGKRAVGTTSPSAPDLDKRQLINVTGGYLRVSTMPVQSSQNQTLYPTPANRTQLLAFLFDAQHYAQSQYASGALGNESNTNFRYTSRNYSMVLLARDSTLFGNNTIAWDTFFLVAQYIYNQTYSLSGLNSTWVGTLDDPRDGQPKVDILVVPAFIDMTGSYNSLSTVTAVARSRIKRATPMQFASSVYKATVAQNSSSNLPSNILASLPTIAMDILIADAIEQVSYYQFTCDYPGVNGLGASSYPHAKFQFATVPGSQAFSNTELISFVGNVISYSSSQGWNSSSKSINSVYGDISDPNGGLVAVYSVGQLLSSSSASLGGGCFASQMPGALACAFRS